MVKSAKKGAVSTKAAKATPTEKQAPLVVVKEDTEDEPEGSDVESAASQDDEGAKSGDGTASEEDGTDSEGSDSVAPGSTAVVDNAVRKNSAARGAASALATASSRPADSKKVEITRLTQRLRVVRVIAILLGFIGIGVAVVAAEEVYKSRQKDILEGSAWSLGRSSLSDMTKSASTAFTVLMLVALCVKAHLTYQLYGVQGQLLPAQRFIDTDIARNFAIEMIVSAVHCPAGVYALVNTTNPINITITYDLDSLLSVLMFARLAMLVGMVIKEISGFNSAASRIVQNSLNLSFDLSFATRHLLDSQPVLSALTIYAATIGILTYAMRVAERPICKTPAAVASWGTSCNKDIDSPLNAAWMVVITTLTVGYGDLYPLTNLGRLISVIAAIIGIVVIALLVNAVSASTKFNADESRALGQLEKKQLTMKRQKVAARVVGAAMLYARDRRRSSTEQGTSNPLAKARGGAKKVARAKVLGPASAARTTKLARALGAWSTLYEMWIDNARCKDSADEVKQDVGEVRAALAALSEKMAVITALSTKIDTLLARKNE